MDKITEFNPELNLDRSDQSALASIVNQPGFKIIERIGKYCADQFILNMLNTDETSEDDILIRFKMAKVGAQYHTMFMNAIVNEVVQYVHSTPSDKPIESAENLDIGEYTHPDQDMVEEPFDE
jgi:hypothetical protein